jgi:hypothetical protein
MVVVTVVAPVAAIAPAPIAVTAMAAIADRVADQSAGSRTAQRSPYVAVRYQRATGGTETGADQCIAGLVAMPRERAIGCGQGKQRAERERTEPKFRRGARSERKRFIAIVFARNVHGWYLLMVRNDAPIAKRCGAP